MSELPEDARRRRNQQRLPVTHELMLEAPLSVGLLLDAATSTGEDGLAELVADALDAGESAAVRRVKSEAGSALVRGRTEQVAVTARVDFHRWSGRHDDMSRPHIHLDVDRVVTAADGTTHPVNAELVRQSAPMVQASYLQAIVSVLRENGLVVQRADTPAQLEVGGLVDDAVRRSRRECSPLGKPFQIAPLDARDEAHVRAKLYA